MPITPHKPVVGCAYLTIHGLGGGVSFPPLPSEGAQAINNSTPTSAAAKTRNPPVTQIFLPFVSLIALPLTQHVFVWITRPVFFPHNICSPVIDYFPQILAHDTLPPFPIIYQVSGLILLTPVCQPPVMNIAYSYCVSILAWLSQFSPIWCLWK